MKSILIPLILISMIGVAFAEAPVVKITARGEATVFNNDMPAAREEALVDAQRNAVEQVLGVQIKAQTAVQDFMMANDDVLSMVNGYVKSSKILSEKMEKEYLVLQVECEVSKEITPEAAAKVLRNYSCVVGFVNEFDGQVVSDQRMADLLISKLVKAKFDVRDASQLSAVSGMEADLTAAAQHQDMAAARKIGYALLSNLVIPGTVTLKAGDSKQVSGFAGPVTVYIYTCWVSVRALETSTGQIISQYAAPMEGIIGTGPTPEKASFDALSKAAAKAFGKDFFEQLAAYGKEKASEITIQVDGIPNVDEYMKVKNYLNNVRFRDSEVKDEGFQEGKTSTFSFNYSENIHLVALKLDHLPNLAVSETTKDKVTARYTAPQN
ncbi:MAG: flagellar assembly protein T N-terminal domain-containing protein [bacterium]|nr:flagellar assembly protein T N-terminal domain-containing protein [bacterium]